MVDDDGSVPEDNGAGVLTSSDLVGHTREGADDARHTGVTSHLLKRLTSL
jgi:hypothetical protein